MASQALSQSLNSLPPKQLKPKGPASMGPPATPNRRPGLRSASSTYPSSTTPLISGEDQSNATHLKIAPDTFGKAMSGVKGHVPSFTSQENMASSSLAAPESLKVLEDCVIFVDVRTDTGDEAGSLFVEMLEGVGARVLTRVGQTCTHIVYKNGLMSTLTRYRLLRDPKPLVVGIAWVVECVEQRKRVDEAKFIVDLDGTNVAGTNKRRRSMLPKLIRREPKELSPDPERGRFVADDISMDGSTSSVLLDEDLTPLELARRRRTVPGSP